MAETRIPLESDKYYHIYNHAIGNDLFFKNDRNYHFFLENFKHYISPYCDLLCYCLMKNHFHLVIRFHSAEEINEELIHRKMLKSNALTSIQISEFLSKQFSNYFNKYAKSFNKQEFRRGSLFKRAFMRKQINSDIYLLRLIRYVHLNPVKDNLVDIPSDWKYSSYNALISNKPTMIIRDEVISLFDNLDNFIYYHKQKDEGYEL
jgi:REP element-mobilizing transposase RayT